MRGVRTDSTRSTLNPGSKDAKPCQTILILPAKKGNALMAEVAAVPDRNGSVNLYFE